MITRDSIATVDLASLLPLTEVYLGQLEIDLPGYEACSVVHWSYPKLFESPTHFWRRSQYGLRNYNGNTASCFGIPLESFSYGEFTEQQILALLHECLDGNPLFDAALRPLGRFHWATSLYDKWDVKIAVAHIGKLYYAAYWETSA